MKKYFIKNLEPISVGFGLSWVIFYALTLIDNVIIKILLIHAK